MGLGETLAGGAAQGVAGTLANQLFAGQANRQARRNADTAYNYDYHMATTTHQREVTDLKAAGLNPILSAGGGGSPGGNAPSSAVQMPQVSMPEVIPALISMKQLEQGDKKLQIERDLADATIIKNKVGNELVKKKTVKEGKGVIRAEAEDEAAGLLRKAIKYWTDPKPPTKTESSGGELVPAPRMGQPKY